MADAYYSCFTISVSRIQARQEAQLTRAVLPLLTLQLIDARESYGYELVERLAALGLDASTGLVYPVLNRMERDGWVTTTSKPSPSGPPRKYFSLTAAGVSALADARTQWEQTAAAVDLATSASGKERT
ncbi:PadR family transcriptional regulator [Microbacterium neimengense]